jgi:hypothetical protein
MIKTLTVSIDDIEKADHIQISGTLHANKLNEVVIISVGLHSKIAINAQDLIAGLQEVIAFQNKFEVKSE